MESKKPEIFKLLWVIFSGVFCAFALTVFMLHYYGPTGQYMAQNVLLSPEGVKNLAYQEIYSPGKKLIRFVFKEMEFSYFDAASFKDKAISIPLEKYQQMYDLVKQDQSLINPSADIESLFYSQSPAKLAIKVKPELSHESQATTEVFQEIQWARESRYYRVQIREQNTEGGRWAYFEHADIYPLVIKLFTQ